LAGSRISTCSLEMTGQIAERRLLGEGQSACTAPAVAAQAAALADAVSTILPV